MAFEPASGDHAIIEVVFGIALSRPFSPNEIDRVAKSHGRWKAELPRLSRMGSVPFFVGEMPAHSGIQIPASSGISFERIKPDGTLDWRILVENSNVFVNCLSYTRWSEIWPRARDYLIDVINIAEASDCLIAGNTLQYIDLFRWQGNVNDYRADAIIKLGDHVPRSIIDKGPFWHLHQGWFEPADNGRILERAQIDAFSEDGMPVVKIDAYMQHQLASFYTLSEAVDNGWFVTTFEEMHEKNKKLLRSFLNDDIAGRIKLDVA